MPDLPPNSPNSAENQGNNEWAPGETQANRLRQAGKANCQGAKQHPQDNADEKGNELGLIQFLERIAHCRRSFVEIRISPDELDLIAELQTQTGHGSHLDICASDASDGDAETIVEI